jgi:hypothetical protein
VLPVAKTAQERKIYGYSAFLACVHIKRMFDFYWLFDDGGHVAEYAIAK